MCMKSIVDYYRYVGILLKRILKFSLIYFRTLNSGQLLWKRYIRSSSKQQQVFKRLYYQNVDDKHKSHLCVNSNFFRYRIAAVMFLFMKQALVFWLTYLAGCGAVNWLNILN